MAQPDTPTPAPAELVVPLTREQIAEYNPDFDLSQVSTTDDFIMARAELIAGLPSQNVTGGFTAIYRLPEFDVYMAYGRRITGKVRWRDAEWLEVSDVTTCEVPSDGEFVLLSTSLLRSIFDSMGLL